MPGLLATEASSGIGVTWNRVCIGVTRHPTARAGSWCDVGLTQQAYLRSRIRVVAMASA